MQLQKPANQQQNLQKQRQQFQNSGTLDAIGSAGIRIDINGTKYNVAADKTGCKFEVSGTVDSSFLKPGMPVHFSAEVDKKGKASAPVSDLEIVSQQTPAATDTSHTASHVAKKPAATPAAGPSSITGLLKEVKGNEISVEGTSGPVHAELTPDTPIKVEVNDARMAHELAHPGDKVDVTGYLAQPGIVIAQDIRITLSGTQSDKKPAAKPADKPTATSATN
jgi:hypothetical protein